MEGGITQERIRTVLAGLMAPLARTLLRCGVSYTEFAEIAKYAFIDAALKDFGVRNRPTNIARVSVMTGISRREVSRLRNELRDRHSAVLSHRNLPAEVLNRWYTDPAYLDQGGRPRPLPFSSSGPCFSTLVRLVSSDIPPRAMEHELSRAGVLMHVERRKIVPIAREFLPLTANEKILEGLQFGVPRLFETILHNAKVNSRQSPRIQRVVHIAVSKADLSFIRGSLALMLSAFAHRIDDYLTSFHGTRNASPGDPAIRDHDAGIGLYYFESQLPPIDRLINKKTGQRSKAAPKKR